LYLERFHWNLEIALDQYFTKNEKRVEEGEKDKRFCFSVKILGISLSSNNTSFSAMNSRRSSAASTGVVNRCNSVNHFQAYFEPSSSSSSSVMTTSCLERLCHDIDHSPLDVGWLVIAECCQASKIGEFTK
jgi:hypothetical protein